jgi:hypothetical protein
VAGVFSKVAISAAVGLFGAVMAGLVSARRVYPTCATQKRAEVGQARLPVPSTPCLRAKGVDARDIGERRRPSDGYARA